MRQRAFRSDAIAVMPVLLEWYNGLRPIGSLTALSMLALDEISANAPGIFMIDLKLCDASWSAIRVCPRLVLRKNIPSSTTVEDSDWKRPPVRLFDA